MINDSKILVVDDEENFVSAIKRELLYWTKRQKFSIIGATSSKEALGILEDNHETIFLLICDLKMPEMSGDQLIIEVKEKYPDIKSILVSGYSEIQGVANAVSAGILAFLQKPWETKDLISVIQKAHKDYTEYKTTRNYINKLEMQLESAGELQKQLLDTDYEPSEHYDIDVTYQPLTDYYCGGDYYSIITIDKKHCIILIGDVSGHGVKPAMITAMLKTIISTDMIDTWISNS